MQKPSSGSSYRTLRGLHCSAVRCRATNSLSSSTLETSLHTASLPPLPGSALSAALMSLLSCSSVSVIASPSFRQSSFDSREDSAGDLGLATLGTAGPAGIIPGHHVEMRPRHV